MKFKGRSRFLIKSLNQERILNQLSLIVPLFEIDRKAKNQSSFCCNYCDRKKVSRFLKENHVELLSVESLGLGFWLDKLSSLYGVWLALAVCLVVFIIQYQFVLKVDVYGVRLLEEKEIVEFVKENSSFAKNKIDTKQLEVLLNNEFEQISFVSCAVKGQTLIINIKEKLMPDEMVGDFVPIVAQKNARISKIDLISGTLCVEVGDYVKKGDVLVQPFVEDAAGDIKPVEAKAEIVGEVYNQGSVDHYETRIEVRRTGKVVEMHEICLFGLPIYTFADKFDFELYEVEMQQTNLAKNLILPFVMKKTFIYEIEEVKIEERFEDAKDRLIEKARENALKNCEECGIILYEFHTTRELPGVTIVNYCVVTEENIGGYSSDC